ncbi:putative aldouronate transport system substrate-binding protein [Caldicellulosiruptor bescii]|uniref:Extracellular solute-binding protein family 1 n=3 Tax=Caldicellulosiruptor bescii TaxID=31899 RepID=B9MNB6_CALBD|nr:extracellular solute-binding protein family 1 [Caldicellulosiruptor bescii DSM 6725]PBC88740.1 putative aldouronate transport system substrate-binding protein [Caldicellulosiruptor bescii]PBC91779.1 putative aldouronate transport system substrate-binding protein [Caldicellulosiruptor bescii]PBD02810.1 putative aldouronate transport system substrate-binding protein [Caldicellulosiruptor bescii]PBD07574.1 putative aldouronate transport system substrate-binding protein [Caldicellulosiruptor bes
MSNEASLFYKSFAEIPCYQLMEKSTGVKFVFKHPPLATSAAQDQFNLMIASRQLTDIIEWGWDGYPGGPEKAIIDKVIVPLNDYIPKYAPNLKRLLDKNPQIKRMVSSISGKIYGFPALKETPIDAYYGPQVRRDWLEKLKIAPPETVDEWYKMLKAFKTRDPNGNGKADERPFSMLRGAANPRAVFDYCSFLVGAWGIKTDFFQVNGRVKYGAIEPQFKEFMNTLAKWWKDGLIDPDILTMNQQTIQANVLSDKIGAYLGIISGHMGAFLAAKKGTDFDLIGVKYPVLKKGEIARIGQNEYPFTGRAAAITTSCKNIEAACRALDWAYSKDGYMAFNFGVKGKSYMIKNGRPIYTDEILYNPQGLGPKQALAKYALIYGPFVQSREYTLQINLQLPQQKEASKNWGMVKNDIALGPVSLFLTPEETKEIANIMNTINTYYDEMFLKMMTGKYNNYDAFVKTLKKMKIEEAIKIYQNAYNRYMQRK